MYLCKSYMNLSNNVCILHYLLSTLHWTISCKATLVRTDFGLKFPFVKWSVVLSKYLQYLPFCNTAHATGQLSFVDVIHYCLLEGLILGLHPANESQGYFVTMSLIGLVQAIVGTICAKHGKQFIKPAMCNYQVSGWVTYWGCVTNIMTQPGAWITEKNLC